jgi:hypothetical protein
MSTSSKEDAFARCLRPVGDPAPNARVFDTNAPPQQDRDFGINPREHIVFLSRLIKERRRYSFLQILLTYEPRAEVPRDGTDPICRE